MRITTWALAISCCSIAAQALAAQEHAGMVPYKDVLQRINPVSHRMHLPDGLTSISLGFATGSCGQEQWGTIPGPAFAAANVQPMVARQLRYTISTGGAIGAFSCPTLQGFEQFAQRYDSPLLQGFDFDIEHQQTEADIDALVRVVAEFAQLRPELSYRFTLASFAGNDEARQSLNAQGKLVMAAIQKYQFKRAVINLMTMNYGPASAAVCVVRASDQRCDMAASALQAAQNFHASYQWPYAQIAVTMMLGINDVRDNVFAAREVAPVLRGARAMGLHQVYAWSLDRDRPCAGGKARVAPDCHGLKAPGAGGFFGVR